MNDRDQIKQLFLRDQQIMRLKDDVPSDQRRFHVCGDVAPSGDIVKDPWQPEPRFTDKARLQSNGIVERALSDAPWRRVALVCDGGLGKTTNMHWLRAQLCEGRSRMVPILVSLDDPSGRALLKKEREEGDALAWRLARLLKDAGGGKLKTYRNVVARLQSAGRIVLLIDGLDHAIANPETATMLKELIDCEEWRGCPVWVAGRPYAFSAAWETLLKPVDDRKFLRVAGLETPEIRFYLSRHAGADVHRHIPDESAQLFAIPRLLHLMSGIIRRELPVNADDAAQRHTLEKLNLAMAADVYHVAYFHRGNYDDINGRGLLGQGLAGKGKHIGLKKGQTPDPENYETRLRRTANLLGALAFEMYTMHADRMRPQPNVEGVLGQELEAFEGKVADRLVAARLGTRAEFYRDYRRLTKMNVSTVEYLVFRQSDKQGLAWHDRTVQAFFAAYWAMNYATADELDKMDGWKVVLDEEGGRLEGFDEFWQFAAEMPDQLLHDGNCEKWYSTFAPSYAPPPELDGDDNRVQWHRRMIYHSYIRLEQRSQQGTNEQVKIRSAKVLNDWRALWRKLDAGKGTKRQQAVYDTIIFRNCPPTLEEKSFLMGSPEGEPERFDDEVQREIVVEPFRMQDFPVTNEQYELFDPRHKKQRDEYSKSDGQPVIYVSFWDAWCFAKWTGHRLPTEVEWEYSCRAGTATRYHFGDEISEETCNFEGNVGRTTAKDEFNYPQNDWKLFDMHGNVWEWCDSRYAPGASARVLRGGSWFDFGTDCRSAVRLRGVPHDRDRDCGFRLAAVPCIVGAKQGQSVGDVAVSEVESKRADASVDGTEPRRSRRSGARASPPRA